MDWLEPRQTFLDAGTGTVSSAHLRKCMLSELSLCEILLACDPVPHKAVDEHFARIEEYAQKVLFPSKPSSVSHFMELFADPPLRGMFPGVFSHAKTKAGGKVSGQGKKFLEFSEHNLVSDDEEEEDDEDDESDSDSDSLLYSDSDDDSDEKDEDKEQETCNCENDFDKYCVKMGYLSSLYQVCKQIESAALEKKLLEVLSKLVLLDSILKTNDASEALKTEMGEKIENGSSDGLEEWALQFVAKMYAFIKAQTADTSRYYTQFLGTKTNL